jgi:hypothetical protein
MHDHGQQPVPASFVALFTPGGRLKPTVPWAHIAERHEFCEDLAQLLTDTARQQLWALKVTEADVLERIGRGLRGEGAPVDGAEAQWVLTRLAELLGWAGPQPPSVEITAR